MKIAVPTRMDGVVDEHFGHCEQYKVYTVSDKKEILDVMNLASPQGCGCKSDIASVLKKEGVVTMLAGGIGEGAINVLYMHGIKVIRGCQGNADELVKLFINGKLTDSGDTCKQHQHGHEGSCPN